MKIISQENILSLVHKLRKAKSLLKLNSKIVLGAYWIPFLIQTGVEDSAILVVSKELDQYHFSLLQLIG